MAELRKIALKVWNYITPEYLEGLYEPMPRKMHAVIAKGRVHTKY